MRHVGLPLEELDWRMRAEEEGLHASGHADSGALLEVIRGTEPQLLIPIHTEDRSFQFFENAVSDLATKMVRLSYGVPLQVEAWL